MTPLQIIALVRDALIVLGVGWLLLKVYSDGERAVKAEDMKAVQTQLETNAKLVTAWQERAREADAQRTQDMQTVAVAISQQRSPVIVRLPGGTSPVPGPSTSPDSCPTASGGDDEGPGTNIRPAINAFEAKYEGYLATCRSLLAKWPR